MCECPSSCAFLFDESVRDPTIFVLLKCEFVRVLWELAGSKVANGGSRLTSTSPPFLSPSSHTACRCAVSMSGQCPAVLLHPHWTQLCIDLPPLHCTALLNWSILVITAAQTHINNLQTRAQPDRIRDGQKERKRITGGGVRVRAVVATVCTLISS